MAKLVKGNLKMTHANCPACHSTIDKERLVGTQAYCACGFSWSLNGGKKSDDFENKSGSRALIVMGVVFVITLLHYFSWDNYSIEIVSLKAQQYAGTASKEDLVRIAAICESRKKSACQVGALLSAFDKNTKDLNLLVKAGQIYTDKHQYYEAREVFETYFKLGGMNLEAREQYAQVLTALDDLKGAEAQYRQILAADRKDPNYIAARSYVEVLLKKRDYSTAKKIIEEYRKAGPTSALFLEKEWKMLNSSLASTNGRMNSKVATQNRAPASRYR